jgi:hypothetical protein
MKDNPLIKVSLKWGLIYAGISSLSLFGTYLFGEITSMALAIVVGILSLAISITVMVLSNKEYQNKYLGGYIKYWQCLVNSILIFVISSLIISFISFVIYEFIDVAAFNQLVKEKLEDISSNPKYTLEIKQKSSDMWIAMTSFKYALSGFVISIISGVIFSLIVSIFTYKKNNSFEGTIKEIE